MVCGSFWRASRRLRPPDRSGLRRASTPTRAAARRLVVFDGTGDDPRLVDLAGRLSHGTMSHCAASRRDSWWGRRACWCGRIPKVPSPQAYGVAAGELTAVVLDPNLRVVGVVAGDHLADRVVALLDTAVHRDPAVEVTMQAPVMLLPRVLDAAYWDA